ncbi:Udp-glycosyltransferase 79b6 [Thalictrum thalictroides]|uniref:Glycosyltransferase n=1 Tax=Thalictrum thalictroides TaxID=46969 RepID=A0A7J6UWX5_THATH|nr:Udp-glycosyltransferase 79b6 [Thalictrum thalictroides]
MAKFTEIGKTLEVGVQVLSMVMTSKFHVAMFPWFAVGHITPYLKLSNKLAERGFRVSFFIPTNTQSKFNHLNLHPHLIQFILLTVPHVDGLPLGAESSADVPVYKTHLLEQALDLTQDQVQIALEKFKPNVIFFDFAYWVPLVARPLGIKSVFASLTSAVTNVGLVPSLLPIVEKGIEHSTDQEREEFAKIPEIYPGSSSIKKPPYEIKGTSFAVIKYDGKISLVNRLLIAMKDSDALCFRACHETEGPYADFLENQYNKPVMLTGPLLTKTSTSTILEDRWANWLGGFEKGSVVYCAFGSECVLEKDQFQELVLGLEQTGLPFLVRLRPPVGADTLEEALPEGFEERVRNRGVVHGGWIQQELILSHPSVGCFIGHCGSGSMWESLISNCQLVLVPHFADQFLNTNFMTKQLKVAVNVERKEEDGWFARDGVCKAVKLVMDKGSEVGEEVMSNHLKLRNILLSEGFETSYINNCILKLHDLLTT